MVDSGPSRSYPEAMSDSILIQIVYEDAGEGWIMASIPSVRGVISQGRTRAEARSNVIDALRLMLAPELRGGPTLKRKGRTMAESSLCGNAARSIGRILSRLHPISSAPVVPATIGHSLDPPDLPPWLPSV